MDMLEQMSSPTSKVVEAFGVAINKFVTPLRSRVMDLDNPIDLLLKQHQQFKDLMKAYKSAGERAYITKGKIVREAIELIELHSELEEKFFYPHAERLEMDRVFEGIEEHGNIDNMILRIKRTKPEHKTYSAKVETFRELVEHHAREEEREMFPICRARFSKDLMDSILQSMQLHIEKSAKSAAGIAASQAKPLPLKSRSKPRSKATH